MICGLVSARSIVWCVLMIPEYCNFLTPITTIMRQLLFQKDFATPFLDGSGTVVLFFYESF
jgi:hypothetical protein